MYSEEDLLMLSGIQHFAFCKRQWALIHIEQLWDENKLTMEGNIMHSIVDNPLYTRKENDIVTLRSVSLVSYKLGLYGISDVVELHKTDSKENAILHPRYNGYWNPYPVEYKRGKIKPDKRDEVQLAAQVICIEEMYNIIITHGWLYYGEQKHRERIQITDDLRKITQELADEMHNIYRQQTLPKPIIESHCKRCSLANLCMPNIPKSSVNNYLKDIFNA
jgi:CRISPR-associated exonuclease Cas4